MTSLKLPSCNHKDVKVIFPFKIGERKLTEEEIKAFADLISEALKRQILNDKNSRGNPRRE